MKKLNDLRIGDLIYYVRPKSSLLEEKDKYGNVYYDGQILSTKKVESLNLVEDKIYINATFEYGKVRSLFLEFPNSDLESFSNKDGYVFFADKSLAEKLVLECILGGIEYQKEQLELAKIKCQKNIEEIRKRYYFILNPSLTT